VSAAAALLADYDRSFRPQRFASGAQLVGGFRIAEFLARGGMAEVYAATDRSGRPVVVKIAASSGGGSAGAARQLEREVLALGRLRHPGIVELLGSGTHQGVPFAVLERIHGRTLRGLLAARSRLFPHEVTAIGKALAEVLGRCHVAGVIHRDVKPDNLFFVRGGGLKLYDFGAALLPATLESFTENDARYAWVGTPEYMAPETVQGLVPGDERTEVYAAGVLLYELSTGAVPFEGTLAQVLLAHHSGPPPSLRAKRPDLPRGLTDVVDRCLARVPSDRFQSMAELGVALSLAQEFPNEPQRRDPTASGVRPRTPAPSAGGHALAPETASAQRAAEIRRAPRASYTTPAVFGPPGGATTPGRIEEISAGGAQFVSLTPIAPGTTGELRFALPMNGKICRSRATVRWEKLGRGGLRVVGVEIHDTSPEALAVISEYVRLMGGS
jgi:serine/threonine-protein kinase